MDLQPLLDQFGYLAILLSSFVRGDVGVAAAGYAAHEGLLRLPLVMLIGAGMSFCWDLAYFTLGRTIGRRAVARSTLLARKTARILALLERYHPAVILGMRFAYGFRAAGPIAVGMTHIPLRTYIVLNAVGALIWGAVVAGVGWAAGHLIMLATGGTMP